MPKGHGSYWPSLRLGCRLNWTAPLPKIRSAWSPHWLSSRPRDPSFALAQNGHAHNFVPAPAAMTRGRAQPTPHRLLPSPWFRNADTRPSLKAAENGSGSLEPRSELFGTHGEIPTLRG